MKNIRSKISNIAGSLTISMVMALPVVVISAKSTMHFLLTSQVKDGMK